MPFGGTDMRGGIAKPAAPRDAARPDFPKEDLACGVTEERWKCVGGVFGSLLCLGLFLVSSLTH